MAQRIHFQDDIYYLSRVVAGVSDAAKIDLDPDLYADKLFDDLKWADRETRRMAGLLVENPRLVERPELMKLLGKAMLSLSEAASDLAAGSGTLGEALRFGRDELARCAKDQRAWVTELRDLVRASFDDGQADTEVVSGDELSELLRNPAADGGTP